MYTSYIVRTPFSLYGVEDGEAPLAIAVLEALYVCIVSVLAQLVVMKAHLKACQQPYHMGGMHSALTDHKAERSGQC